MASRAHLQVELEDLEVVLLPLIDGTRPIDELETAGRVHSVRVLLGVLCAALLVCAAITLAPFKLTVTEHELPLVPLVALGLAALATVGLWLTFVFPKGPQKIRLKRLMFWRR